MNTKILLCIIIPFSLSAQKYIPFTHPDNYWRLSYYLEPVHTSLSAGYFFSNQDTIIKNKFYKKLLYCEQQYFTFTCNGNKTLGYFRDDTINRRVYFQSLKLSEPELLLFDFNKNINDTIDHYILHEIITWPQGGTYSSVKAIIFDKDSVLLCNNYRKRIKIKLNSGCITGCNMPAPPACSLTVVEGSGIIEFIGPFGNQMCFPRNFICYVMKNSYNNYEIIQSGYTFNNHNYYCNSSDPCSTITNIHQNTIEEKIIRIKYNSDVLYIVGNHSNPYEIKLYDVNAKLLFHEKINENEYALKIESLPAGVYVIKINETIRKIIKY
jgi:hypothetical protein